MPCIVPGTRIEAALKKLPEGERAPLADYKFPMSSSAAIVKGHEERALLLAGDKQNVYWYDQFDASLRRNIRLCFFGESEWEVLDRLGVAEVMLG